MSFYQFLPVFFPKVKADWLFLLYGLAEFLKSHVTLLLHHLACCVQFFFRPNSAHLQILHFVLVGVYSL